MIVSCYIQALTAEEAVELICVTLAGDTPEISHFVMLYFRRMTVLNVFKTLS